MRSKVVFWFTGTIVLMVALIVSIGMVYDNAQKVQFVDEEMGTVFAYEVYYNDEIDNVEDFRQEHLESITELNIGYTGYYTTLEDIEKCTNLEWLYIGAPRVGGGSNYYAPLREMPKLESGERINQIQNELASILKNCNKISWLYIGNPNGICKLNSLEFLRNQQNLKALILQEMQEIDYAPIWECSKLTTLSLSGCDVSNIEGISQLENLTHIWLDGTKVAEAGDILNIPNLKYLEITGTPLAENEEELALIYEAFPDIELKK